MTLNRERRPDTALTFVFTYDENHQPSGYDFIWAHSILWWPCFTVVLYDWNYVGLNKAQSDAWLTSESFLPANSFISVIHCCHPWSLSRFDKGFLRKVYIELLGGSQLLITWWLAEPFWHTIQVNRHTDRQTHRETDRHFAVTRGFYHALTKAFLENYIYRVYM